jgi:DNA-binding Lrp family transcriptional regulator
LLVTARKRPIHAILLTDGQGGQPLPAAAILKERGVIRKLGAVFDPEQMGFTTLLVAMKVAEDQLEAVARQVSRFRAVTHNYQREHAYNLWFTIVAPSQEEADRVCKEAAALPGVEAAHKLPALRRFKVHVQFDVSARKADDSPL